MATETYSTGRPTNNALKNYSFTFDAADKNVNFTDGLYATQTPFKYGALMYNAVIKFDQSLALFPVMSIRVLASTWGLIVTTPVGNTPNVWFTSGGWTDPETGIQPVGETLNVRLNGITGSGVTALSFEFMYQCIEFEV